MLSAFFAKAKLYIYGAVGIFVAGLYVALKITTAQKEKYKAEAKLNESKAKSADKRIEAHEKREEVEQDNANASDDDVNSKLRDYYRD